MRNRTSVPAATFKALFQELIPWPFLYAVLRRCGLRRRCPAVVSAGELICALVFHVVGEAGTLAQHVKVLTGKRITDGALAQRRALLPLALFEQLMRAALEPKADLRRHPDAFYRGLRLCGVDENDQLQILALPYIGQHLQMVVLLPRSRDGIEPLESSLTPASLAAWTSGMREQEVNVALPKFKMSSGFSLAQALEALGLKDAFDLERADFSGMDGRAHGLYLNAVLHKAYIEVNEKGTEAAAATAVVVEAAAKPIEEFPREFRADHPFLFLVRESATGSILFMGRVVKPES